MPIEWEVPPSRRVAFVLVLLVLLAGVLVTVFGDFRVGGQVFAGALALAAAFRAMLPEKYCLGLLVRTRRIDVGLSLTLAVLTSISVHLVPGA